MVHAALRENDIEKLKEYFPCDADRKRVMADIYGTQNTLLLENGLVDTENEQDFSVKLASLQAVWDNIAPGFHHWFKKRMSDISIDCLILSSAERHGIMLHNKRFRAETPATEIKCQNKLFQFLSH